MPPAPTRECSPPPRRCRCSLPGGQEQHQVPSPRGGPERWVGTHHLPNLHDVVLRHGADDPGLTGVPGEVGDLGCVASMDELQRGNAVRPGAAAAEGGPADSPAALEGRPQRLLLTAPHRFYWTEKHS